MEKETKKKISHRSFGWSHGEAGLVGQASCDFNREKFMLTIEVGGRIRHYSHLLYIILSHALTLLRS